MWSCWVRIGVQWLAEIVYVNNKHNFVMWRASTCSTFKTSYLQCWSRSVWTNPIFSHSKISGKDPFFSSHNQRSLEFTKVFFTFHTQIGNASVMVYLHWTKAKNYFALCRYSIWISKDLIWKWSRFRFCSV